MILVLIANVICHFLSFWIVKISVIGQGSMWFVLGTTLGTADGSGDIVGGAAEDNRECDTEKCHW